MADSKRPRRGADDYNEVDVTAPNVSFRGQPPRIATPLSDQLRPSATAQKGRPGSSGNEPVVATTASGTGPGPGQPRTTSNQPLPGVLPAPARGRTAPPLAAPENTPPAGTELPPDHAMVPVTVRAAELAQRAAQALSQNAVSVDDVRATLTGGPGLPSLAHGLGDVVRVHRLPPPAKLDPRLIMARAPDSAVAASYRVLRHRLAERGNARVVLVTSPGRKEGKTTLAMNLALAMSESGRARVLLVEANLRQPAIANALGFRPPVCFGEQLEFHRTHPLQPWVVVENITPFLHVAAVSPEAHPRPLVDGPAVAIALEQLRGSQYEQIIIDSPPVLGSADVNLLEEHVDAVLFAIAARRSHARGLRRAVAQIGAAKVVGSVLIET